MEIKLNGETINIAPKTTLLELLEQYKIETKSIVVAINLESIKKEQWDNYIIQENDVIECLTFLGGG
ncbi:thiamine biosynthesis protein ThiS [Helicobacter valdiviensis]|uniref:Thiamine biosynthesis protein ThiS n=1 Tax=Helicobacter valdiviensis TaxID=1458358 RepID=A0A2W6NJL2_9HELI|nr:sulfur carrier protein ThiS [Helicobacter valdiviensis]PZT47566.1 thiamine biosynthesis protein ThiS [Helicobacter valdiviensis]